MKMVTLYANVSHVCNQSKLMHNTAYQASQNHITYLLSKRIMLVNRKHGSSRHVPRKLASFQNFTNWKVANVPQPDQDGDCVRIIGIDEDNAWGQWNDRPCSETIRFACQKDAGTWLH